MPELHLYECDGPECAEQVLTSELSHDFFKVVVTPPNTAEALADRYWFHALSCAIERLGDG